MTVRKLSAVAALFVCFVFLSGFAAAVTADEMKAAVDSDKIYKNIYINGIDVSSLTKDEALQKLNSLFTPDLNNKVITLSDGSSSYDFRYEEFNVRYDFSKAVDMAYDYARDGSLEGRYFAVKSLAAEPHKIIYEPVFTYNEAAIKERLKLIENKVYVPPVDAGVKINAGQPEKFTVADEVYGRELNFDETSLLVGELLKNQKEGVVQVAFNDVKPKHVAAEFENALTLLGTYSTNFTPGVNARNTNIATAASKINNVVIFPGEVFSTNAAFGEMTYENGYREAQSIINGKFVDDIGGGICQVSSTLYNAILFSELQIVERINHSLKVGYLDYGFDATLATPVIDLKFKNNTTHPIIIECVIDKGKSVIASIYGYEGRPVGRKLVFKNELVETVPPAQPKLIQDPTLPVGQQVTVTAAKNGYKYNVYKYVYENGVQVQKVRINTSTYKPVVGEIKVGTKINN